MVDEGWGMVRVVVGLGYQSCSIVCRTDSAAFSLTIVVGRFRVRVVGVPWIDRAPVKMLCVSWRGVVVRQLIFSMLHRCILNLNVLWRCRRPDLTAAFISSSQ